MSSSISIRTVTSISNKHKEYHSYVDKGLLILSKRTVISIICMTMIHGLINKNKYK